MAAQVFSSPSLAGTPLRSRQSTPQTSRHARTVTVAGVSKKVNTYDEKWSKVISLEEHLE